MVYWQKRRNNQVELESCEDFNKIVIRKLENQNSFSARVNNRFEQIRIFSRVFNGDVVFSVDHKNGKVFQLVFGTSRVHMTEKAWMRLSSPRNHSLFGSGSSFVGLNSRTLAKSISLMSNEPLTSRMNSSDVPINWNTWISWNEIKCEMEKNYKQKRISKSDR